MAKLLPSITVFISTVLSDVLRFNVASGVADTSQPSMAIPRVGHGMAFVNGRIWAIGGTCSGQNVYLSIYCFKLP